MRYTRLYDDSVVPGSRVAGVIAFAETNIHADYRESGGDNVLAPHSPAQIEYTTTYLVKYLIL